MTKTKRKTAKPFTINRTVYEVEYSNGVRHIEASTVNELKAALTPLLGLDPYSAQATAHLVHLRQGNMVFPDWSISRLGTVTFQADSVPAPRAPKKSRSKRFQSTSSQIDAGSPAETLDNHPQVTLVTGPASASAVEAEQPGQAPGLF